MLHDFFSLFTFNYRRYRFFFISDQNHKFAHCKPNEITVEHTQKDKIKDEIELRSEEKNSFFCSNFFSVNLYSLPAIDNIQPNMVNGIQC